MPTIQTRFRVPSYRQHRPSGQAVVTLGGRDIYLGKWRTVASLERYERVVSDWLANGRKLPEVQERLTVAEIALRFWEHAKGYYRKNGEPTSELDECRQIEGVVAGTQAAMAPD